MVTLRDIVHCSDPGTCPRPHSAEGTARCPKTQALRRGACPRAPTIYKRARPTEPKQGRAPTVQQLPVSGARREAQACTAGRGVPSPRPAEPPAPEPGEASRRGCTSATAQQQGAAGAGGRSGAPGTRQGASPSRGSPAAAAAELRTSGARGAGRGARARRPGPGPGRPCW